MIYFENNHFLPIVAALALITTGLIILQHNAARGFLQKKKSIPLLLLRVIGLIGLIAVLLNPYFIRQLPSKSSFSLGVLVDVSQSMDAADLPKQQKRIEAVRKFMDPSQKEGFYRKLGQRHQLIQRSFVENSKATFDLKTRKGTTAIGTALMDLLEERRNKKPALAGVLLISDGISLQGDALEKVAQQYRQANIPISAIGTGQTLGQGDLKLQYLKPPKHSIQKETLELRLTLHNSFSKKQHVNIGLFEDQKQIGTRSIEVDPESFKEFSFILKPEIFGSHVYRASLLDAPKTDLNHANNTAITSVNITKPKQFDILYMAEMVTPDYSFLKNTLENDPQFSLKAILHLAEKKFFNNATESLGFPPEGTIFLKQSVILADTQALAALKPEAQKSLLDFLTNRGGGLLVVGDPAKIPESLKNIMPVRSTKNRRVNQQRYLSVASHPVFKESADDFLKTTPSPYIPSRSTFFEPSKLSLSARVVAKTLDTNTPVLTIQSYGAGRVAYLGTRDTWRWALESQRSHQQYGHFWRHLLAWLATGSHQALKLSITDQNIQPNVPVPMDIFVRDNRFEPAENAKVRLEIRDEQDQIIAQRILSPDPLKAGQYKGEFQFEEAGVYRVEYIVELPDEKPLKRKVYVPVLHRGNEIEQIQFQEDTLKQISKATRGSYRHYQQASHILPLSKNIKTVDQYVYLARHWIFLLFILGTFGTEWLWRRYLGLK